VKVAAYQAPLLPVGSFAAVDLIQEQVRRCEAQGVSVLCCPEAILGGLADYAPHPNDIALNVASGELLAVLRPLSSDTVTIIVGFTERRGVNELFNSAAVLHKGTVIGVYRKQHPAIRRSVYQAGPESPAFTVGGLTFGVLICNDSNHLEPAQAMAERGATALFVPTNNGLPRQKADVQLASLQADVTLARRHLAYVLRADVAGTTGDLVAYGTSGIVAPCGGVLSTATGGNNDLLVVELPIRHRQPARHAENRSKQWQR
jgi:predicted amidohydrolase